MDPSKAASAESAPVPPPPAYTQTPGDDTMVAIRLLGRDSPYLIPRAFYNKKKACLSKRLIAAIDKGGQLHLFQSQFEELLASWPTTRLQTLTAAVHDGFTDINKMSDGFRWGVSPHLLMYEEAQQLLNYVIGKQPNEAEKFLDQSKLGPEKHALNSWQKRGIVDILEMHVNQA